MDIDTKLLEKLQAQADLEGRPVKDLLEIIIEDYLIKYNELKLDGSPSKN